jgi:hypothetical protein
MQNVIILLVILIPVVLSIIGIVLEKKKRSKERNEMFPADEVKLEKKPKIKPESIDAVAEISKILQEEVEKAVKPKSKRGRKPGKKKKPEFPIEPTVIKPKSKRGRKPKNKDKKDDDQMLLS